ncbi:MAG: proteinase inhibitor I4 serpin [Verrucomicrobia bacterium]|nr:MAG: proteinase inhibitor I4 serpin [Verrucomicrobiota bacterium]
MKHTITALLCAAGIAAAADNMKAFPPAEEGMVRHVLSLPPQADEAALKVELSLGKMVMTDSVNHYFFGGKIEVETIEGWGFDRYILKQLGPMAGTLMAPPPGAPKVERFITLGGDRDLVRYNSRLPLVVYVPKGVAVRYRIWHADREAKPVPEG